MAWFMSLVQQYNGTISMTTANILKYSKTPESFCNLQSRQSAFYWKPIWTEQYPAAVIKNYNRKNSCKLKTSRWLLQREDVKGNSSFVVVTIVRINNVQNTNNVYVNNSNHNHDNSKTTPFPF